MNAGVRVNAQTVSGVNVTIGTITVPADAAALVYPGWDGNHTGCQEWSDLPSALLLSCSVADARCRVLELNLVVRRGRPHPDEGRRLL